MVLSVLGDEGDVVVSVVLLAPERRAETCAFGCPPFNSVGAS